MPPARAYYTSRSENVKTGNIPQQFVGATREESKASCQGCPLLKSTCYAQLGTPAFGHAAIVKSAMAGKDYSLETALDSRHHAARYFRFGAIGDPSGIGVRQALKDEAQVRASGLGVLSYTHFWKTRGKGLRGHAMASCDTWQEVDFAVDQGWRAAIHVKSVDATKGKTDHGRSWIQCPAEQTDNRVKCNQCGLCDATRKGPVIVFVEH